MFETGIKVIDLIQHSSRAARSASSAAPEWARRCHHGTDQQRGQNHGGFSSLPRGRAHREGNDLWTEMTESGVIKPGDFANSKCALVYGQMTEPPGARLRCLERSDRRRIISATGSSDTLLFIDNIFRFTQAGSEVSTLLAACLRLWATSRISPPRWASCKRESPRPARVCHFSAGGYVPADI